MLMSVVDELKLDAVYPELAGARVLVAGLSTTCGVDIARAFADHRARLIVRAAEDAPEIHEVAALLNQSAAELKLFTDPDTTDAKAAVAFAQGAAQRAFGGLDVAVNLVAVRNQDFVGCADLDEVESAITAKLSGLTRMTRILANRMRLTMTEGSILNVIVTPEATDPATTMLVGMLRSTVAALTREEAQNWADDAIRINSVVAKSIDPFFDDDDGSSAMGVPDVAALALYLASARASRLSGHIFAATRIVRQRALA